MTATPDFSARPRYLALPAELQRLCDSAEQIVYDEYCRTCSHRAPRAFPGDCPLLRVPPGAIGCSSYEARGGGGLRR